MSSSLETGYVLSSINTADGVKITHQIFNASTKAMKYITFTYAPYNRVGDQVHCTISKKTEARCELTGPFYPKTDSIISWDAVWYNPTVFKVKLVRVEIQYMDGTEETIEGDDITTFNDPESEYKKIQAERKKVQAEKTTEDNAQKERIKQFKKAYSCFMVLGCLKKAKSDEELKFHVNQGLWLFIIEVLACVFIGLSGILSFVGVALAVIAIVFSLKGVTNIQNNVKKELPLLGKIKFLK